MKPDAEAAINPDWTIRRAGGADASLLAPMVRAYWQIDAIPAPVDYQITECLADWLERPSQCVAWLASREERPIGYLLAVYVLSLEHLGLTAEIDELYVTDELRNGGLGSALLAAAQDEFRRMGCTNVSLQVAAINDDGQRFYARHGFHQRSRYLLMDKNLTSE